MRIYESVVGTEVEMYNGTSGLLIFPKFTRSGDGTGNVNMSRKKFGGYFFTSTEENAAYYGEYLICKVKIRNVYPADVKSPQDGMRMAIADKKNYMISEILDGGSYSDIVVVPISNIEDVQILEWIFVGDTESYREYLDEFFFGSPGDEPEVDDDGNIMDIYKDQSIVDSMLSQIDLDINYQLTNPEFKAWYESI